MPNDLYALSGDLTRMAELLGGPDAMRKAYAAVGNRAKTVGVAAAAGDLGGDALFSGWRRPGPLALRYTLHPDGSGITIHRDRKSAGPWRVAEEGRHPQRAFAGPSINQRTGLTSRTKTGRVAARRPGRARRWNGVTAGKGSWSKAEAAMARMAPEVFEREALAEVQRLWGG